MTVTISPLSITGGGICLSVTGAIGTTLDVVVQGDGMSVRGTIELRQGSGMGCLRLPAGFGITGIITITDDSGVENVDSVNL